MITENQPVFIGEADDTNEFGVRIQVGSLDQQVRPATAIAFAGEIIAAATRAIENDQEEARERAEAQESHGFDQEPVTDHTGPHLTVVDGDRVPARVPWIDENGHLTTKQVLVRVVQDDAPDGGDAA